MQNKIPDKEYKEILEKMPVFCVDAVIYHKGKILLLKRKNEPDKGQFGFPGGRLYKNETFKQAAVRKAFEEAGLKIEVERMIGTYEYMTKKGPFPDLKTGVHTPVTAFLVKLADENQEIKLDETSSHYKWADKIEENFHPYVKKVLEDSKVFA